MFAASSTFNEKRYKLLFVFVIVFVLAKLKADTLTTRRDNVGNLASLGATLKLLLIIAITQHVASQLSVCLSVYLSVGLSLCLSVSSLCI